MERPDPPSQEELRVAVQQFRTAAAGGDLQAMNALGVLLVQTGDVASGEAWLRSALQGGEPRAAFNLGRVLELRGDLTEAEAVYRAAGEGGDATALRLRARQVVSTPTNTRLPSWSGWCQH